MMVMMMMMMMMIMMMMIDDDECLHKLHWCCPAWTNPAPLCDLKRKSEQFIFKQYFEPFSMKLKTSHQNVSPSNYFDQGRFGDQLQTFSRMIPTSNLLCPKQISSTSSTETPKSINKLFFSTTNFKQRPRRDIVPATFVCCLLRHGCAWLRANKWPAASEHLAVPEVGGSVLLKQQASTHCHLQHCAWHQGLHAPHYNKWNMKHGKITRNFWWKGSLSQKRLGSCSMLSY